MFKYTPITMPHDIIVVGCGGTGSRLVPLLAQFLRSIMKEHNSRGWLEAPNIVLCDFDTIEHKNLLRQNFIAADVDKNKAAVLANRYGKHYGLNISAMTEAIKGESDIYDFFFNNVGMDLAHRPVMIIMCVDSVVARRLIIKNAIYIDRLSRNSSSSPTFSPVTIIDSGNEDNFGQVNIFNPIVLGYKGDQTEKNYPLPKLITVQRGIDFLPMDLHYYLDMEDHPNLGSCADLDQTLAINAMVATSIMAMVQNFYYRKPFTYNTLYLDLMGGGYSGFNTAANFKSKSFEGPFDNIAWSHHTRGEANAKKRYSEMFGNMKPVVWPFYELQAELYFAEQEEEARRKEEAAKAAKAAKEEAARKAKEEAAKEEAEKAKAEAAKVAEVVPKKAEEPEVAKSIGELMGAVKKVSKKKVVTESKSVDVPQTLSGMVSPTDSAVTISSATASATFVTI